MDDHCRALELAYKISVITSRPSDILLNVDEWERCEAEYQEIHQRLYGEKPKCHIGRHSVDCTKDFGVFFHLLVAREVPQQEQINRQELLQ